jgi:hypothetical protein
MKTTMVMWTDFETRARLGDGGSASVVSIKMIGIISVRGLACGWYTNPFGSVETAFGD